MKKRNWLIAIGAVAFLGLMYWFFFRTTEAEAEILVEVEKKNFKDMVVCSGELLAKNSEKINGPSNLRRNGIYNVKIQDIVPEGTVVKAGDYVASLDRTQISSKIADRQINLDKTQSQYIQAKLDTTLTLRAAREAIKDLEFSLQQKKLTLEQSAFEPPAIIKQAKLDLEKSERDLLQIKSNYKVKKAQARAKMAEVGASLSQARKKLSDLMDLQKEFNIHAPKAGMVVYVREWGGRKRKVGSEIQPWDPAVATLPDLSEMLSKTYVNEVEIRKVKKGQMVELGLDAFPDAKMSGKVIEVANVGEKRSNSDSKVFEVMIQVVESDSNYRPGMTSSNKIITSTSKDVLIIPLESVFTEEGISFVYKKTTASAIKQEIKMGNTNEDEAIVLEGIEEKDQVYLAAPEFAKNQKIVLLDTNQKDKKVVEKTN